MNKHVKKINKEVLDEDERIEWKKLAWNSTFKKWRWWYLVPSLHGKEMGKKWKTMTDFIFLGSKLTADCSHELKRHLLLGRIAMTNLHSTLKSRDITLPTKVHLVKAMVFPVVIYTCESWTIKKGGCQRINAFELWCWRGLLRVPWTTRRSNQSVWSCSCNTLATWWEEPTHYKRPWCCERLNAGIEGDDRGWDGWMASMT